MSDAISRALDALGVRDNPNGFHAIHRRNVPKAKRRTTGNTRTVPAVLDAVETFGHPARPRKRRKR